MPDRNHTEDCLFYRHRSMRRSVFCGKNIRLLLGFLRLLRGDDADDEGENELLDGLHAENIDHDDGEQGRDGGIDGAEQGLVGRQGHVFVECVVRIQLDIFTHTVEDDDGCVDGITENREQCRDDVGIHRELEQRVCDQHEEQVMRKAEHRRNTRLEVKADGDIHEHQRNGKRDGRDTGFPEIRRNGCADRGDIQTVLIGQVVFCFQCLKDRIAHLCVDLGTLDDDLIAVVTCFLLGRNLLFSDALC